MVTFSLVATVDISEILYWSRTDWMAMHWPEAFGADDRADLILRAQALGDVDRLLRVALGVVADQLDLLCRAVHRWR